MSDFQQRNAETVLALQWRSGLVKRKYEYLCEVFSGVRLRVGQDWHTGPRHCSHGGLFRLLKLFLQPKA